MTDKPLLIRVCYPLFVVAVVVFGALGLLQVWMPQRDEWITKMLWSLVILAGVSGLVLAAYRTVTLAAREGG